MEKGVTKMDLTTMNGFQLAASVKSKYPDKGNNLVSPTLGLCCKAGELSQVVKDIVDVQDGDISSADIQTISCLVSVAAFHLACICEETDINMLEVCKKLIEDMKTPEPDKES